VIQNKGSEISSLKISYGKDAVNLNNTQWKE